MCIRDSSNTDCVKEEMSGEDKKDAMYYFKVDVRVGAPGCADDDSYISRPFKTFAGTCKALVYFKPHRYWRHLRSVQEMWIWREGQTKVNLSRGCFKIEIVDLSKLNVTKEEFDKIIESIDNNL